MLDVADDEDVLADIGLFRKSKSRFVELASNEGPLTESVVVEMSFKDVVMAVVLVVVAPVVALPTSPETNAQI